jgi:hypothetical protein
VTHSNHARRRWLASLVVGVVAASTFGAVGPASAATPSNTKLTTSTPTIAAGGTAKLKAVVKPASGTVQPTGTVTFKEGATTVGTAPLVLVDTVQTAKLELTTLTVGRHTFLATYSGSAAFNASTSLSVTVTVTAPVKSPTTTKITTSTPAPGPGQDVKLKAVVKPESGTAKPTGTVTFREGQTVLGTAPLTLVGTIQTAKLTIVGGLPLGRHTITASYAGSAAFNASTSADGVIVTVAKASTVSTLSVKQVTTNPGKSTIAVAVTAQAPATGVPTGVVTFVVDAEAPQVFSLNAAGKVQFPVTFAPGSTHTVSVTYAGDTLFNGSTATASFIS